MGKIKKILENELVGGTQSTDIYPVTSTKAVYDENNERLDNIINEIYSSTVTISNSSTESDLDIADEQGNVILRLQGGHIRTKNFDSSKIPAQMDDNGTAQFQITDEFGNIIVEFKKGNFHTKNFDSTKSTSSTKIVKDNQDRNILILSKGAVINGKLYL